MNLKWPLSRGSQIKRHFTWGGGETEDRASVSTSPLFKELLINNTEQQDISTNNKMHDNTIVIKTTTEFKIQKYVCSEIIW